MSAQAQFQDEASQLGPSGTSNRGLLRKSRHLWRPDASVTAAFLMPKESPRRPLSRIPKDSVSRTEPVFAEGAYPKYKNIHIRA